MVQTHRIKTHPAAVGKEKASKTAEVRVLAKTIGVQAMTKII
jgi:hypothetical protein